MHKCLCYNLKLRSVLDCSMTTKSDVNNKSDCRQASQVQLQIRSSFFKSLSLFLNRLDLSNVWQCFKISKLDSWQQYSLTYHCKNGLKMSLHWTLIAGFLYAEIAVVLLLLLPFVSNRRWSQLFKSRFLRGIENQLIYYFYILFAILVLFFLGNF